MFGKHCTDEQLVAFLDGELPLGDRRAVERHLRECWQCRVRLEDLKEQALALARRFKDDFFPSPGRVAEAIRSFAEWERLQALSPVPPPQFQLTVAPRLRFFHALAAAACIAVVGLSALWLRPEQQPPPDPAALIAEARETESALAGDLLHQEFAVEVTVTGDRPARRTTVLQTWTDPNSPRFAARWTDSRGELLHAVWRNGEEQSVYRPASTKRIVTGPRQAPVVRTLAEIAAFGIDLEQLEAGFVRWLETRNWEPVRLTEDMARFVSAEDAVLEAVPAPSKGRLWLRATRVIGDVTAEVILELDARTRRPRLQQIRFRTPERTVEFRLTVRKAEFLRLTHENEAWFEPRLDAPASLPAPQVAVLPEAPAVTPTDPAAILAVELQVRYALHRLGACLGEPIEVIRNAGSGVVVRGVVNSSERKATVTAELAEIASPPLLVLELKTAEEALEAQALSTAPATADTEVRFSQTQLPIQDHLHRYFREHASQPGDDVGRRERQFTREILADSQTALAHAWALRRLMAPFDSDKLRQLEPQSRWLLEVMLDHHFAELARLTEKLHERLDPVLAGVAQASDAGRPAAQPAGRDPHQAVQHVVDASEGIHERIAALLAGDAMPVESLDGEGATGMRMLSPAETAASLLAGLTNLADYITSLEAADGLSLRSASAAPVGSPRP